MSGKKKTEWLIGVGLLLASVAQGTTPGSAHSGEQEVTSADSNVAPETLQAEWSGMPATELKKYCGYMDGVYAYIGTKMTKGGIYKGGFPVEEAFTPPVQQGESRRVLLRFPDKTWVMIFEYVKKPMNVSATCIVATGQEDSEEAAKKSLKVEKLPTWEGDSKRVLFLQGGRQIDI